MFYRLTTDMMKNKNKKHELEKTIIKLMDMILYLSAIFCLYFIFKHFYI